VTARNRTIRFYSFALVALLVLVALQQVFSQLSFTSEEVTSLNTLQEKQLEVFVDMNKLLITLATLSLGGIGAFVLNRYKSQEMPWYQVWRVVASWVFCGLSLYCGVLTNEKLIWMLQNGFFDLTNPRILWVYRSQFWTLAAAIFFLADFFYRGLRKEPAASGGRS
jgi:hypothetical protein